MIKDHGMWEVYTPNKGHEHAPAGAVYSRMVDDHATDWYEYHKQFNGGSVLMTAQPLEDGSYLIQAVTRDAHHIFPGIWRVIEDTEYVGDDPFNYFHNRVYNADSRSIGDKYVPPAPPPTAGEKQLTAALEAILERLNKLEKK